MSKVEFQLPKGFSIPEGKSPGDDIEIMCTLKMKPNGSACLVKLGDVNMPGYDEGAKEEAPQKSEFIQSYNNSMSDANTPA